MTTAKVARVASGALFVRSIGRFMRRMVLFIVIFLTGFVIGTASGNDLIKWSVKAVISHGDNSQTKTSDNGWHLPWQN